MFLSHVQEDYDISSMPPTVMTINKPLILIVQDYILYARKTHNRRFRGVFRGLWDKKVVEYVYV